MSSSPVELLEGWRLNQTRGLSALATVEASPPAVSSVAASFPVVSLAVVLFPAVSLPVVLFPPQATRLRARISARNIARVLFITILLFEAF